MAWLWPENNTYRDERTGEQSEQYAVAHYIGIHSERRIEFFYFTPVHPFADGGIVTACSDELHCGKGSFVLRVIVQNVKIILHGAVGVSPPQEDCGLS